MIPGTGHRVRKTSRRMADGREIVYFDDTEPFVARTAAERIAARLRDVG